MTTATRRVPKHTATVGAVGGALGWSVITRLLQFGLSLIGSIVVTRTLGPDNYGQLTILRTALAFVTALCGLGLGQAVLRYLPTARARGDVQMAGRVMKLVILPQLVAWLLAIGLMALAHDWIVAHYYPQLADLFLLGAVLAGAELAFLATNNLTTAFYDTRSLSIVILGGAVAYLALAVLALGRGFGVAGVMIATGLSQALMAAVLARRLARLLGELPSTPPVAAEADARAALNSRDLYRYALPFAAIAVMNLLVWRQSESLLLAHFHTKREAGFWDLAYRMPQMILEFVPGAIWPLLMAGFSEIYTRDRSALSRAMRVYYKLLFLLVVPIAIGGAAVGDRAIVAFYGEEFLPAGVYCQLLFLVFSMSFFSTPMTMAFYVLERPWYSFWQYLGNAIVLVGLDFLLIPKLGLTGALIPMTLIIAASPFVNAFLLRRLGVRPQIPWAFLGRVLLAAIPCALIYPARLYVRGKVPVALSVLAAGLLYLVGLRVFRVLKEEEAELLRRSRLPFASWLLRWLVRPEASGP
ncbi:MAG TPA: oligosaccharide flippase family protein [Candidatus Eisenbacteria bacterium]